MNIQDWFHLGFTSLISLLSKGFSRVLQHFQHDSWKASILWCWAFFMVQLSHPYMIIAIALTIRNLVGKVMSLCFNMLSRFVIAFLPRSKHHLISWLQSPPAVTLELKNKVCHHFHFFRFYLPWCDRTGCHDLSFLNVQFFFLFVSTIII